MNYYNENDPKAAAWLRELIKGGHISAGEVDERSIVEVKPSDLSNYAQCHFFAGIGGWSLALRLADWPDDRPLWTMSCPCQPFAAPGKGLGEADPRHLWPAAFRLVRECGPDAIIGEQVASPLALGWFDGVSADLEAEGYATAAFDLCSPSVGAPNIRQRLYWLAVANQGRRENAGQQQCEVTAGRSDADGRSSTGRLAEPDGREPGHSDLQRGGQHGQQPQDGGVGGMGQPHRIGSAPGLPESPQRQEGKPGEPIHAGDPCRPWDSFDILPCTDGKARRIEPGSFPLATGVPGRVGLLRGYGNAINAELAAEFVRAVRETL